MQLCGTLNYSSSPPFPAILLKDRVSRIALLGISAPTRCAKNLPPAHSDSTQTEVLAEGPERCAKRAFITDLESEERPPGSYRAGPLGAPRRVLTTSSGTRHNSGFRVFIAPSPDCAHLPARRRWARPERVGPTRRVRVAGGGERRRRVPARPNGEARLALGRKGSVPQRSRAGPPAVLSLSSCRPTSPAGLLRPPGSTRRTALGSERLVWRLVWRLVTRATG